MKVFDLVAYLKEQIKFSTETFGPIFRHKALIDHIGKELVEIEEDPMDLEEWVDVAILALDGAWRSGHSPEMIAEALEAKLKKNKSRLWPDWRKADPNKAIEHDRSEEIT